METTLTDIEPHENVSRAHCVLIWPEKNLVKMTFNKHGITAMNREKGTRSGGKGIDVPIYSEEKMKLAWMRDPRIRLIMQMELMACGEESDWLIRCYHCADYNCSEEYCPPIPLPILPVYHEKLRKRGQMSVKGILPPTLKMILNIHYPLPVKPQPLILPSSDIPPSSSPLPSNNVPESLGDDQTEREKNSLQARADDDTAR